MKFLLDVCTASRALRQSLVELGHDVLSATDGYAEASDEALLALAYEQDRVLVTEDKDFGKLIFLHRLRHLCPRRTGCRDHERRQCRGGAGGTRVLRPQGRDGRLSHPSPSHPEEGRERPALDEETEIRPVIRKLVEEEFRRGASLPIGPFPEDGASIPDTPRLVLVIVDREVEWQSDGPSAERIARWTRERGTSPRLYPASLVWCARKPGRELRDRVELWLAWQGHFTLRF